MFPHKGPTIEGPRLGDLSVSSSAYGMPIPILYGTMRVAGNMIWSSGIREHRHKQKVGKGGGGQTNISYTYTASFQIAFGEGPADDVLRIWADSKLIYDKTTTSAGTTKPGVKFRFHPGSETQLPDPLVQAHVGASRTPAHRGLVTIVFEDLALADFGNRIPNISAEITYNKVNQKPVLALDPITTAEGGILDTFTYTVIGIDWTRGVGYLLDHSGDAADSVGLRRFNLTTMKEDRQAPMSAIVPPEGWVNSAGNPLTLTTIRSVLAIDPDGYIYLQFGSQHGVRTLRIEPMALREVARFGSRNDYSTITFATNDFGFLSRMVVISAYGASGREDFLYCMSSWGCLGLLKAREMSYLWGAGGPRFGVDDGMARGRAGEGYGEGWALLTWNWNSYDTCRLYRMRVFANAAVDPLSGQTLGVEHRLMAEISPSDVRAGASGGWRNRCGALAYDPSDNSLIFMVQVRNPDTPYVLKWREDLGIVWKTPAPYMINWNYHAFDQARIAGNRWTITRNRWVFQVDTATGAVVSQEQWPSDIDDWGDQVYDGATDCLYLWAASGFKKAFLGRGGGAGAALSAIVADLSKRAGLGEGDIHVAELTDVVPGYVISRQTTVRAAIEPLSQAYFFDGVESDFTLRFPKRGKAPVAAIPATHLLPMSGDAGETWRESRTQELELPERVTVIAVGRDTDYQQMAQSEKRIALTPPASALPQPLPAMHARGQLSIELPIALTAPEAKRIAARTLSLAWLERNAYECVLPPDWLRLDPADVITVTFPGASFRVRLTNVDTGADFTLGAKGVSDSAAAYTSGVQADGGQGFTAQILSTSLATYLILADVPLLRDIDDTGGIASRLYLAGAGYGEPGWRGAVVYNSADGAAWVNVAGLASEAAYGATLNALAAPASAFCTDETNVLRIAMIAGGEALESVSQEVMLNGANAALLIKPNGEPEIIQFRDVTFDGPNTYSLRGLLRGRRGTDVFMSGHALGETFLLLEANTLQLAPLPLGDLGATRQWRAVTIGALFEDAEIQPRIHTGRDLKPYAAWAVKATKSGSPANITISWTRRTRIGGEWKDGTGSVPLAEGAEAYEVDILEAPGGAAKRTLATTTASVTYANADILGDFGAIPASLSVVVYQLSAVIGRGFPRAVTVEIL